MAEPQPQDVHEGAADPHAPTGTAEDRKAAAALSALDVAGDDTAEKKEVDSKALDKAMKGLNVKGEKKEEKEKKTVKVEAGDVSLLVSLDAQGGCGCMLTVVVVVDRSRN
jgi:hypothetical protein